MSSPVIGSAIRANKKSLMENESLIANRLSFQFFIYLLVLSIFIEDSAIKNFSETFAITE